MVTIADRERQFSPPGAGARAAALYGDLAQLVGYDLEVVPGRPAVLDLTLYWQALRSSQPDLDIFVHVLDAGAIIAQRDRPPDDGGAPTSTWVAGEYVADGYEIPLPASLRTFSLAVGLVDRATGRRVLLDNGSDHSVFGPFEVVR
jgi:hypothetical protein